jgi:Asp-tRNA(Asn)/Glu-tRNA(Gln) amidotransferase A subunit family amidase
VSESTGMVAGESQAERSDAHSMRAADFLTITDGAAALRGAAVTSVELVEHTIAVADAVDEQVGIFLKRFRDSALRAAADVDAKLAAGESVGPLAGIPVGVKDIITTSEAVSTAQSLVLDPAWSKGDAVVVSRLRSAGAIVMGKLTTMEFALGAPDPEKPFPIPRNPWDLAHWAGGSSSGSGSSIATGAVLGTLGTDTSGSIRLPAAYCGITGLMPSYGRVPKSGCVPLGHTLDHIGPMARSARDCALLLSVLAGHHPSDLTSIEVPVPDYVAGLTGDLTGVRIGVDRLTAVAGELADPALPSVLDAAIDVLRSRGAEIVDVELPLYAELSTACAVTQTCEALAYHLPDLRTRWGDYFAETRRVLGSGVFYSAADYVQAQRVRHVGMKRLAELFGDVDLVLTPTSSTGAPTLAEIHERITVAPRREDLPAIHTEYWSATGNPAVSVPIGFTAGGLPLGMQLAGRPFDEALVLRAGDAYQQATDFHLRVPPIVAETGLVGQATVREKPLG